MQHVKKPFRPGGTRRVDSAFFPPRQGWWARHVNQPAPAWKTNVGVDLAVEDGQVGANILEAAQAAYTKVSGGASSLMSKLGLGPDPSGKAAPAAAAPKAGGSSSMTTYVLLGGAALAAFFILPKFLGKR